MNFSEKIRNFLVKLQGLPDDKKKIILWTVVVVLAITMGFFWLKNTMDILSNLK